MRLGTQFLARLCRLPKQEFKIQNSNDNRDNFCDYVFVSRRSLLSLLSLLSFLIICLAMQISYKE